MARVIALLLALLALASCVHSTMTEPRVKKSRIRDCPPGMVLICETRRDEELSRGGDEEIPEFERCYCEPIND